MSFLRLRRHSISPQMTAEWGGSIKASKTWVCLLTQYTIHNTIDGVGVSKAESNNGP